MLTAQGERHQFLFLCINKQLPEESVQLSLKQQKLWIDEKSTNKNLFLLNSSALILPKLISILGCPIEQNRVFSMARFSQNVIWPLENTSLCWVPKTHIYWSNIKFFFNDNNFTLLPSVLSLFPHKEPDSSSSIAYLQALPVGWKSCWY